MNEQKPIAADYSLDGTIDVHSVFKTIQGEGPFCGERAMFIRLYGCNLRCPGCFVGSTLIRMGDGTQRRIDQINVGDSVLAYDKLTGLFAARAVTAVLPRVTNELYRVNTAPPPAPGNHRNKTSGNAADKILCTGEHPFLVRDRGWVEARNLQPGDVLIHLSSAEQKRLFNPMRKAAVAKKVSDTLRRRYASGDILPQRMGAAAKITQSARMRSNNPMRNPATAARAYQSRKTNRISGTERRFMRYTDGLPLDFVGDGKLVVSHKFPDFKVRDQNKIIEVWASDALHAKQRDEAWQAVRAKRFAAAGYETLFVALPPSGVNVQALREKVANFIHNGEIVHSVERTTLADNPRAWASMRGRVDGGVTVYDLTVDDLHTYVANGKVVHNCDTEYTAARMSHTPAQLVERLRSEQWPRGALIVLTGGEPFRQNVFPTIYALLSAGWRVQVETNGVLAPPGLEQLDYFVNFSIVCSPKTNRISDAIMARAIAFKYVLRVGEIADDGLPTKALGHAATPFVARPRPGAKVYVQPMDEQDEELNEQNTAAAVASAMKHGYTLQLQIHKFAGLE